jgi:hypothetical protein
MTSKKDRQLRQASGQAVKRAGGARRPSCGQQIRAARSVGPHAARCTRARHGSASVIIYRASGAHTKNRRGGTIPGISLSPSLSLSLYLSLVSTPFPLTYKGGRGTPWPGGRNSHTHVHMRALHQRLGSPFTLSPVCNPYCKLSARAQAAQTGRRDILPEPV